MKHLVLGCVLMTLIVGSPPVRADIRVNLLTRLNQIMDDVDNRKMSQTNKLLFLDAVGREYGRRGFYIKRDTVLTTDQVELYDLNSDFAGIIHGAYLKTGDRRVVLPVIDRDSAFKMPDVKPGVISYAFIESDGKLGLQAIPVRVDTVVLLYFAYPAALSGDSTEWSLPNHYEDAALFQTAADCLRKIGTAEAQRKADIDAQVAESKLSTLANPDTQSRQVGTTDRP